MPKTRLNLFFTIFLGLLFIGPNTFAQNNNPEKNQPEKNQIEEDHDTKKLDKLLINYNKDQEQVLKDAAKIIQKDDTHELTNKELGTTHNINSEEEPAMSKADLSAFSRPKKVIDHNAPKVIKYSDQVKAALASLQKFNETELLQIMKNAAKGSLVEVYFERYPKLPLFAVRLIKDKHALLGLASIVDDHERSIYFAGIMVSTMLLAIFLKRLMKKEGRGVAMALSLWFLRFLIMASLRFGILIYFYSVELTPAFNVMTKTFF